jgi:hypothetical protein
MMYYVISNLTKTSALDQCAILASEVVYHQNQKIEQIDALTFVLYGVAVIDLVSWKPYRSKVPLVVYLTQTTGSSS